MAIDRSSSTSEAFDARQARDAAANDRAGSARERPSPEQTKRFQDLLQSKGQPEAREQHAQEPGKLRESQAQALQEQVRHETQVVRTDTRDPGHDEGGGKGQASEAQAPPTTDASLLWQAQAAVRDASSPQATPPPQVNPNAFADLIERHVRQMAVTDTRGEDGKVLLRIADQTLPGTDLLLTRTPNGWTLRADVRSRQSFDAIREAAPRLAERFAERNLGELTIDPHFHG